MLSNMLPCSTCNLTFVLFRSYTEFMTPEEKLKMVSSLPAGGRFLPDQALKAGSFAGCGTWR